MPRPNDSDRTIDETGTNPKTQPTPTKLQSRLISAVDAAAAMALVAMMVHVLANVAARSIVGRTVPHTFELTQYYYLPVLALLGFVAAQHRGEHITTEVFYGLFRPGEKRAVTVVTSVTGAVIAFGLAYYTYERAEYAAGVRLEYGVTSLEVWPVLYLVPACFAVMGVQIMVRCVHALRLPEPALDRNEDLGTGPMSRAPHGEETL